MPKNTTKRKEQLRWMMQHLDCTGSSLDQLFNVAAFFTCYEAADYLFLRSCGIDS